MLISNLQYANTPNKILSDDAAGIRSKYSRLGTYRCDIIPLALMTRCQGTLLELK